MPKPEIEWFKFIADESYIQHDDFEVIDGLTIATLFVLKDSVRPNAGFDSFSGPISRLHTIKRHFAVCTPPDRFTPNIPRKVPVDILHRLKGGGKPNAFGFNIPDRDVLVVWTDRDHTAKLHVADRTPVALSRRAIQDMAGLLLSPMFLNYDPVTGGLERVELASVPTGPNQFPTGSFDEAAAAYSGIVSFLTRSLDLERVAA